MPRQGIHNLFERLHRRIDDESVLRRHHRGDVAAGVPLIALADFSQRGVVIRGCTELGDPALGTLLSLAGQEELVLYFICGRCVVSVRRLKHSKDFR